jgi:methoxymalonate biosynthesis acyl carrier protein
VSADTDRQHVTDVVRDFLTSALGQPVLDDQDVFAAGLANSLFALELVIFVETQLGLTLENEDLKRENFCSARAIADLAMRRTAP